MTTKLTFPEVMNTSEVRNDFYVFLLGGVFLQDTKKSVCARRFSTRPSCGFCRLTLCHLLSQQRNIEVSVRVLDKNGDTIENGLVRGSGESGSVCSEYRTTVYYHTNAPLFDESMRVRLPAGASATILAACLWPTTSSRVILLPFLHASGRAESWEGAHLFFIFWHVSTSASTKHAQLLSVLLLILCLRLSLSTSCPLQRRARLLRSPAAGRC